MIFFSPRIASSDFKALRLTLVGAPGLVTFSACMRASQNTLTRIQHASAHATCALKHAMRQNSGSRSKLRVAQQE